MIFTVVSLMKLFEGSKNQMLLKIFLDIDENNIAEESEGECLHHSSKKIVKQWFKI